MKINGTLPPTTPFHIARAYGVGAPGVPAGSESVFSIGPSAPDGADARLSRLIAAVVPGGVDFSGDSPAPSAGTLAMYRNPAEKNAAATAVALGRRVDVSG